MTCDHSTVRDFAFPWAFDNGLNIIDMQLIDWHHSFEISHSPSQGLPLLFSVNLIIL